MNVVTISAPGPSVTVQDLGRPGQMAFGLSQGGAMDRLALAEAAAVLRSPRILPALEMAGMGARFRVAQKTRFALTGAPMQATLDAQPLAWHGVHVIEPGQELRIAGASSGVYGYLTFAGGLKAPDILGSQSSHVTAGIGTVLKDGDQLSIADDPNPDEAMLGIQPNARFDGGTLRFMPGPQTDLFDKETLEALCATEFRRSVQANRQGIRLDHPNARFQSELAAGLASDFIMAGDIQLTGDGIPYVLMSECQTVGGYPRIGTVIAQDLPKLAQAPLRSELKLQLISIEEATKLAAKEETQMSALRAKATPRVRDPRDISDLLSYQLISGVTRGDELEDET